MNTLDIIILLCFVPALISGISKGFIEQAIALVSLVLGAWLAYRFSALVSSWLDPVLEVSETALNVISFAAILIVVILALFMLGKMLSGLMRLVLLGWLDRLLGVVFALVKAALFIGLIITMFNTLNLNYEFVDNKILDDSVCYQALKDLAYAVFPYLKRLLFNQ